jgi:hypothetical protein
MLESSSSNGAVLAATTPALREEAFSKISFLKRTFKIAKLQ